MEKEVENCDVFSEIAKHLSESKMVILSEVETMPRNKSTFGIGKTGDFVAVRPCNERFKNKTYLGIYIAEVSISATLFKDNPETDELKLLPHYNPMIFIPDLNEIVFGCGSWWKLINNEEKLKQITDADIENVWYVKALKWLDEKTDLN